MKRSASSTERGEVDWVTTITIIVVLLFIVLIASWSIQRDNEFEADCQKRGGTPIIHRGGRVCFAKGVVLP